MTEKFGLGQFGLGLSQFGSVFSLRLITLKVTYGQTLVVCGANTPPCMVWIDGTVVAPCASPIGVSPCTTTIPPNHHRFHSGGDIGQ
jgi:hypothetical protein